MEQDETPNNVYALFPGIDTAPFGVAGTEERVPPLQADEGWSAVPERSITGGTAIRMTLASRFEAVESLSSGAPGRQPAARFCGPPRPWRPAQRSRRGRPLSISVQPPRINARP